MSEMSNSEQAKAVQLKVTANLLQSRDAEKVPKAVAYAFSAGGRLLARETLDEKGTATLSFGTAKEARSVRVMVGPEIEGNEIRISDLQRRGAEEQHIRINAGEHRSTVELSIYPNNWLCWLEGLCFVKGTLLKREVIGGIPIDLPVCNATVEIYEVDPIEILIPRLSDDIIEKLREYIINPPPPPPPPEGPFGGFRSSASASLPGMASMRMEMTSTVRELASSLSKDRVPMSALSTTNLQFLAQTTNTAQFRQVLVDNAAIIRYIFCLFYPIFFEYYLVGTATTDECGHFETFFFKGCNNPGNPNLYFTAEQQIFPFLFPPFTLYAPTPIPCFTYWNYACGTEVTLYTTEPFALTCPPCAPVIAPNNWVLIMAIGNYPLSLIRGTSSSLQATTNATNLGLTDQGAPWGGLLRPRIEFDNSLRDELGVQYYQVSYRKGSSDSFQPLPSEVHRHYTHDVGGNLVLEVYPLGPQTVNGVPQLFEIPPGLPPTGQWSFPDIVEDHTSAKFPSDKYAPPGQYVPGGQCQLVPGTDTSSLYQLKVDLFDASGNPVDIGALGIKYCVPTSTNLNGTIFTEDAATLGLVSGNSFIMTLHIDNNHCCANLSAPTLDGVPANACGVLEYSKDGSGSATGSVTMDYKALHPNGFATYSFDLYRGAVQPSGLLTPPSISGSASTSSFSTAPQAVSYLLGTCPVAAFSENLYVAAMATDGLSRLSSYDDSSVIAFVLSPENLSS